MKPKQFRHFFVIGLRGLCVALCGLLAACTPQLPRIEAHLTPNSLWQPTPIQLLGLPALQLQRPGTGRLRVYIEGDGDAFTLRGLPSQNPTPRTPVGLELAEADAAGAPVVYLGRPCQWVSLTAACTPTVWTTQRFTPEILRAYSQHIAALTQGHPAILIGFSGGAWLAYGMAQNLPNIARVISVAGNLDPNLINRHHRVPELPVAPWPTPARPVPLLMYVAEADRVIPAPLSRAMLAAQTSGSIIQTIPNTTHVTGWAQAWPTLSRGF